MCALTAYLAILGTAIAGLFGASWLALVVGSALLTLVSLIEHRNWRTRFVAAGLADVYQSFALSNLGTSCVASTAAYGLGLSVRFLALA